MKKLTLLLFVLISWASYAQSPNFQKLLSYFPEVQAYSGYGSYEMLQNAGKYIDNQLAWEFLWQKNKFMKPEETFCQAICWNKVNDKIGVVLFFTGEKDNTIAYMISVQTYDLKKGKMIDELRNVASFGTNDKSYPAGNVNVGNAQLTFTTLTSPLDRETVIKLDIKSNGKLKESK